MPQLGGLEDAQPRENEPQAAPMQGLQQGPQWLVPGVSQVPPMPQRGGPEDAQPREDEPHAAPTQGLQQGAGLRSRSPHARPRVSHVLPMPQRGGPEDAQPRENEPHAAPTQGLQQGPQRLVCRLWPAWIVVFLLAWPRIPEESRAYLCAQTSSFQEILKQIKFKDLKPGEFVTHQMCREDVNLNRAIAILRDLPSATLMARNLDNKSTTMWNQAEHLLMKCPDDVRKHPMWPKLRDSLTESAGCAKKLGRQVLTVSKTEAKMLHDFAKKLYNAYTRASVEMLEEAKHQLDSNLKEFASGMQGIKERFDDAEVAFMQVKDQGTTLQNEARDEIATGFSQTFMEWLWGDDQKEARKVLAERKFNLGTLFSDQLISMAADMSERQVLYSQFLGCLEAFVESVHQRKAVWAHTPELVFSIKTFGLELATFVWNANTAQQYWHDV